MPFSLWRRATLLAFVALCTSRPAFAETGLSLSEALAYAKKNQPELRAELARLRAEQAAARVPGAAWYPRLSVGAEILAGTANNTTASYVSPHFDLPRIGGTKVVSGASWRPYPSTLVGAGLNQELFDFGRIAAETAAADAQVAAERNAVDAQWLDISLGVEESYFAVNAAKSIERAAEDNYQRARVHRDFAKSAVASGMRPSVDLARAEADLARADSEQARARGGLSNARANLAAAIGMPATDVDATEDVALDDTTPSLEEALARAERAEPRVRQAIERARAEELRANAIGAQLLPDLSATATISGRAGGAPPSGTGQSAYGDGFLPSVPNWDVGVVLTWPLFDATTSARRDAARARAEAARADVGVVRELALTAVRRAYVQLSVAKSVVPNLVRARDAAKANADEAEARFKNGLGTSVELADAESLLAEAEIQLALGRFEVARSRAALGRSIAESIDRKQRERR